VDHTRVRAAAKSTKMSASDTIVATDARSTSVACA
jgi:hypothetical protein